MNNQRVIMRFFSIGSKFKLFKFLNLYIKNNYFRNSWNTRKESINFTFTQSSFIRTLQKSSDVTDCGVYVCKFYLDFLNGKTESLFVIIMPIWPCCVLTYYQK